MVSPDILGASASAGFGAAWPFFTTAGSLTIQIVLCLWHYRCEIDKIHQPSSIQGKYSDLVKVLTGIVVTILLRPIISQLNLR
jgi:iron complex transport system permease protein